MNMRLIGIEILRSENMCREIPIVLSALIMGCTSVQKLEATGCEVILHSEEVNPVDGGEPEDERGYT